MDAKEIIRSGRAVLGIELGSTRIKAVLVDDSFRPIAQGVHEWENQLVDGLWTYSTEAIWYGLQDCYVHLREDVRSRYDVEIESLAAIGVSAMMHGYMPFGKDGRILVPFRTWRNTMTEEACRELTPLFAFNIPQRWSIAHLYQAILNGEEHVKEIDYLTTLAGYIHWQLSGESKTGGARVLGVGEASGMFPIDSAICDYDREMLEKFDVLAAKHGFGRKLKDILPKVLPAGEKAGILSAAGAKLLDPSGSLESGVPMCPPEGDAGTGMTATDSTASKMRRTHSGPRLLTNRQFFVCAAEVLTDSDQDFVRSLQAAVREAMDEARFVQLLNQMRESAQMALNTENLDEVVKRAAACVHITEAESAGILQYLHTDGDYTLYGLANAVTRYSQDVESYDRASKLEEIGYTVMTMTPDLFRRINQVTGIAA